MRIEFNKDVWVTAAWISIGGTVSFGLWLLYRSSVVPFEKGYHQKVEYVTTENKASYTIWVKEDPK